MKITIGCVTVEGANRKELIEALEFLPKLHAQMSELGIPLAMPQRTARETNGGAMGEVESTPWADLWKAETGNRFRMSKEEGAAWGDNREGAAKVRCEGCGYKLANLANAGEQGKGEDVGEGSDGGEDFDPDDIHCEER